MQEGSADID